MFILNKKKKKVKPILAAIFNESGNDLKPATELSWYS